MVKGVDDRLQACRAIKPRRVYFIILYAQLNTETLKPMKLYIMSF